MKVAALLSLAILAGCSSSTCQEWAVREVTDYNNCPGNETQNATTTTRATTTGKCAAPGVRQVPYCRVHGAD